MGVPGDDGERLRHDVLALRVEPDDARVGPEPGLLAAGEPARGHDGLLGRLRLGELAVEDGEHLGVADRAGRGRSLPQPVRPGDVEAADLVQQTLGPHALHPGRDPLVQLGPVQALSLIHI